MGPFIKTTPLKRNDKKMSGLNCDVSVSDLQRELSSKQLNLDNLLLDNERKQERLAKLEATIQARRKSIGEKNSAITATERKIRDGNVVNNRMIEQIKVKTDQLRLLEEEEMAIELCNEAESFNQCQLVVDMAKFLNMVAEFMISSGKGVAGGNGNNAGNAGQTANIIRELEDRLSQLQGEIDKKFAGRTQSQIQAEINAKLSVLEQHDKDLAEVQEKLSMLETQPKTTEEPEAEKSVEGEKVASDKSVAGQKVGSDGTLANEDEEMEEAAGNNNLQSGSVPEDNPHATPVVFLLFPT